MAANQVPSVGDDVFYRLPHGNRSAGEVRPAKIVRIWGVPHSDSVVQLQVFTDGQNDGLENVHWATSVKQGIGQGQFFYAGAE